MFYNLNARFALPPADNAVLYLMLPSIAIVELLKLIPSTERARSIGVNYSFGHGLGTTKGTSNNIVSAWLGD
jgi:hypothetical protein